MKTIRVISLHQPWASAMAAGIKKNETRSWPTDFRGPIAIHAAKTPEYLNYYFKTKWQPGGMGDRITTALRKIGISYPLGVIVGVTNVIDCVPVESVRDKIGESELVLGGYENGRFAWITDGMIPLEHPEPMRGHQRFWNWTPPDDFELRYVEGLPDGRWVKK